MQNRVFSLEEEQWQPVRPSLTRGITGIGLIPEGHTDVTVTITRVEPAGEFKAHADRYHHVLYFLQGAGEVELEGGLHQVGPGTVVRVRSGTPHRYSNRSTEEMILITINLPVH